MIYLVILGAMLILLFLINLATAKIPSGFGSIPRRRSTTEYFTFPFHMLILFVVLPIVAILTIFEILFTREHKMMNRCFAWFDRLVD